MHPEPLRRALEAAEEARPLLVHWGVRDLERGRQNLQQIAQAIGVDGLGELVHQLGRLLPRCADADMALNNFERFLTQPDGATQLPLLLEGRARTLETLLQLFSTSQFFSDILISH